MSPHFADIFHSNLSLSLEFSPDLSDASGQLRTRDLFFTSKNVASKAISAWLYSLNKIMPLHNRRIIFLNNLLSNEHNQQNAKYED